MAKKWLFFKKKKENFFKIWKKNSSNFLHNFNSYFFFKKFFLKSLIINSLILNRSKKKAQDFFVHISQIKNKFRKKIIKMEVFLLPFGQSAFKIAFDRDENQNFNNSKSENKLYFDIPFGVLKMKNLDIFQSQKIKKGNFFTVSVFYSTLISTEDFLPKKIFNIRDNITFTETNFFPDFNFFFGSKKITFYKNGQLLGAFSDPLISQSLSFCKKIEKRTILRFSVGPELRFNFRKNF